MDINTEQTQYIMGDGVDYEQDQNCTIVAVGKKKTMTLREVADRMGVSFVRVKQIQDIASSKVVKKLGKDI